MDYRLLPVIFALAVGSPTLKVTPPAFSSGAGNDMMEEDNCYDRSAVTSGGYVDYCKSSLSSSCAAGKLKIHFEQKIVDGTLVKKIEDVDKFLVESDYRTTNNVVGYVRMWKLLQEETSDPELAQECLELGTFTVCNLLYPFCLPPNTSHMLNVTNIKPCRSVCERLKERCSGLLQQIAPGLLFWPPLLDCNNLRTDGMCSSIECNVSSAPEPSPSPEPSPPTAPEPSPPTAPEPSPPTAPERSPIAPEPSPIAPEPSSIAPEPSPKADPRNQCQSISEVSAVSKCSIRNKCKKIRSEYSKNKLPSFHFLAEVEVHSKLITTFKGNCSYAYNVSIVKDFDLLCGDASSITKSDTIPKYNCDDFITVYTGDKVTDDCSCVTHHIQEDNTYVFGGHIEDGQWLLSGREEQCIIAKNRNPKTDKFLPDCKPREKVDCKMPPPVYAAA